MRYVFFAVIGFIIVIISGSVLGVLSSAIVPDLLLITVLAIALNEQSVFPVVFTACFGLLYDDFYSSVLGCNAIPYTVTVVILLLVVRKKEKFRVWEPALVGFCSYLFKELFLAVIVFALGYRFDLFYMFYRYMLPGSLLTAGLMIPAYYLMRWLYSFGWIRPRKVFSDNIEL